MVTAPRRLAFFAVILLMPSGCKTSSGVSKFCGSATSTLASADPVFRDLAATCLREVNIQKGIGSFEVVQKDPSCELIAQQADGARAATRVLSDYFSALNSLATFGTAKVGSDASALLSRTGAALGATSAAQTALGSMASFLATAATGVYKQKSLDRDLIAASKNIGDVIDALVAVLQTNYLGPGQGLTQESQKLTTRYKEFAQTHATADTMLTLDRQWHDDESSIEAKRASAESLVCALLAIKQGTANLAANAHSIKAKDLSSLLEPYGAEVQTLIPQIQKGF